MADLIQTDSAEVEAPRAERSSPDRPPATKVTRARATTSDVPRRPSRTKVAASAIPEGLQRAAPATEPTAATAGVVARANRPADVTITQGGADLVEGDTVTITQGGASVVNAHTVQIRQGGIANAQADEITVSMGGVALARADRVSVEMGGIGIALAREAHLTQGAARSVIAQNVHVDQGLVGTALAGRVTFERPSGIFLLIAGRVEGPVQALLDWRGAIAFGAAFGLLVGLIRRR